MYGEGKRKEGKGREGGGGRKRGVGGNGGAIFYGVKRARVKP